MNCFFHFIVVFKRSKETETSSKGKKLAMTEGGPTPGKFVSLN